MYNMGVISCFQIYRIPSGTKWGVVIPIALVL